MKRQRSRTAKRKKNKFGEVTLSDLKICYKLATAIKTVQYWQKNRAADEWHRTDSSEINPVFMIKRFQQRQKTIKGGGNSLFNKYPDLSNHVFRIGRLGYKGDPTTRYIIEEVNV